MGFRIALNEFKDIFNFNEILELIPPILVLIGISQVWEFFGYKEGFEYFLIISFVYGISSFSYEFFDTLNDAVKIGYLSRILTLPIHPLKFLIFQAMGRKMRNDYIFALLLLPFVIYNLGFKFLLLIPLILFIIFYTISFYLIYFYISIKLEGSWAFFFLDPIIQILGGSLIPIDFLRKMIPFYDYLPFKYFGAVAWDFLRNPLSIIPGFFWMAIFSLISFSLYKRALKYYEAYGV